MNFQLHTNIQTTINQIKKLSLILIFTSVGFNGSLFADEFSDSSKSKDSTANTSMYSDSDKVPVSTGKYITGGILGSVLGFGIGHAIQDRYSGMGLTFTIAEGAGVLIAASGLAQCDTSKTDTYGNKIKCSDSASSQILLGYGIALGFHIWEIVDVWTGATPVETEQKSAFLIIPQKEGALFNFSYIF